MQRDSERNQAKMISWIIPCFNEDCVIEETIKRIKDATSSISLNYKFEYIFIDDGSTDKTRQVLKEIASKDKNIKIVALSRNFGHQVSLQAGLNYCNGSAALIIDADLQDPPEIANEMLELWEDGFDVIYGRRLNRAAESILKRFTAKIYYRVLNYISDIKIPINTGDFRLIDKKVILALKQMPERGRYMRGLISWCGFKQTYISYNREARFAGRTKYSLDKMVNFALDGITSFSRKPLRMATYSGVFASGLSLIGIIYVLAIRLLTNTWVAGWATLAIAILLTSSIQLIFLGILGEYIGRSYIESKSRPLYFVDELIGFEN